MSGRVQERRRTGRPDGGEAKETRTTGVVSSATRARQGRTGEHSY